MMAETDLIKRGEAIEAIENIDWYHQNASKDMVIGANPDLHQAWYKANDVYKALESVPSAQPERKTGRWVSVTNGRGGHECDLCHNYAPAWQTGEERLTDFCPNCGAYMREG